MIKTGENWEELTKGHGNLLVVGYPRNERDNCGEELGIVLGLLPIDGWESLNHFRELPNALVNWVGCLGRAMCD